MAKRWVGGLTTRERAMRRESLDEQVRRAKEQSKHPMGRAEAARTQPYRPYTDWARHRDLEQSTKSHDDRQLMRRQGAIRPLRGAR